MNVPGGRVGRTRGPAITLPVRRSTRPAQPPRTRGLDRLDHPRLRGLDRSSVRPALRVIELVEITARESVELVDERTRLADTPAVGPRITNRVRRSTRQAQPPRTRGLDRLDHPRMRGLDRFAVRPALRVIELVEITARASVQLV